MNDFEIKYLNIAKEIILKSIDKNKFTVFLFGSRADKTNLSNSDIDVGFIGDEPISSIILSKIYSEIEESIVPYHIDLIDFYKVDPKFKEMALKKVIIWNQTKDFKLN
jgi:uncharacterized protein